MKFEHGKIYRTRGGQKATIFMADRGDGRAIGAVHAKDHNPPRWLEMNWYPGGSYLTEKGHNFDLISEWREPVKYSVELWLSGKVSPELNNSQLHHYVFGNYGGWDKKKFMGDQHKYRVTVEEIPE